MSISAGSKILASDITALSNAGGAKIFCYSTLSSNTLTDINTALGNNQEKTNSTTNVTFSTAWVANNCTVSSDKLTLTFKKHYEDVLFFIYGNTKVRGDRTETMMCDVPGIRFLINGSTWVTKTFSYFAYSNVVMSNTVFTMARHGAINNGTTFKMQTVWSTEINNGYKCYSAFIPDEIVIMGVGASS